jgi:hypothetical protein
MTSLLVMLRRSLCILGVFCCLSLLSYSVAQHQASHSVTVALPRLLSVRFDDTSLQATLSFTNPRQIHMATHVGVRSNDVWTLAASFSSCQQNDSARVSLRAGRGNERQTLRTYPRVILAGTATQGWETVPLNGVLEPSVNSCHGNLVYTLAQP